MNLIDKIGYVDTEVELKYCERCGGLFLRFVGASLAYCGACVTFSANLLSTTDHPGDRFQRWTRRKLKNPRLPRGKTERLARIDNLHGSAAIEVRA